jgi:DNA-binding transcriptional LysR family regulator
MALNTNRLRILREVAARESIAAAARALGLTGPGVSQQLATLEREVGTPLLERSARSVRLTEAGRYLARRADVILSECEEAVAGVKSFTGEITGSVRISTNEPAGPVLLHTVLEARTTHPGLKVTLVSVPTPRALPGLRTGDIDIVLSFDWQGLPLVFGPATERHDLLSESCQVVLPPSHRLARSNGPLRLEDLAEEQWCLSSEHNSREAILHAMRSAGFTPEVVYEPQFARSIARGAEAGIGIGIVPHSADLRGLDVVVRPLDEPALHRHLFAVVRAGSSEAPSVKAILDAMRKGIARNHNEP